MIAQVVIICILILSSVSESAIRYVALTGTDTGGCTVEASPCRHIQYGMNQAVAGDTVQVGAGIFYERITVTTSGSTGNLITLQGTRVSGEILTIIDGSDALNGGWTLATSTYGGLYQHGSLPYEVGWMGVDDGTNTYHILSSTLMYNNRTYFGNMDLPAGYKAAKSYLTATEVFYWDGFEAFWTGGSPTVYVRWRNFDNPNSKNMRISPRYGAAMYFPNIHHWMIKDVHIRGAFYAVHLPVTAADITFDGCKFTNGFSTIALYGAQRTAIRNSIMKHERVPTGQTTTGPMFIPVAQTELIHAPGTVYYAGALHSQMNWWWKNYSWEEGIGIDTFYDQFQQKYGVNGLEVSNSILSDYPCCLISLKGNNVRFFGNDLSRTGDAEFLFGQTMTDIQVYDNYFHDSSIPFRSGNWYPTGYNVEIYIYRNIIDQPVNPSGRSYFYLHLPNEPATIDNAKRYWYHNSFLGGNSEQAAIFISQANLSSQDYFLNNVFSTGAIFFWDTGAFNNGLALFDYNWTGGVFGTTYVAPRVPGVPVGLNTIRADSQQVWTARAFDSTVKTNFTLPIGHAARNAGIDITSAAATALVGRGTPLPGFSAGYFTGAAPHMGAVQDTFIPPESGPALDTFDRANVGPPPSSQWTTGIVPGNCGLKVVGNLLVSDTAGVCSAWWNVQSFAADQEASLVWSDVTTTTGSARLYMRLATPGTAGVDGYVCQAEPSPGSVMTLRRLDNGTLTGILAQATGVTWATGDSMGCTIIGSQLCGLRKPSGSETWTSLVCHTDATYPDSGFVGTALNVVDLSVDDFWVGAIAEDTERDNLVRAHAYTGFFMGR